MQVAGHGQARSKNFLTKRSSKKQQEPKIKHNATYAARNGSLDMFEKEEASHPFFSPFATSIVPDPLNELPTWYHREVETATTSAAQFRANYPLHNPSGPRWYRNHHLLPRELDGRPPSVFSPAFPPMASAPERGHDPSRMAGPSRTPSGSPLPTPSSSQIRIQEPPKPRSRKISQGTHDSTDIPENTDLWAQNGHHSSYDRAVDPHSPVSPASPSPPNQFNNRPRRASTTQGTRHRTTAPSPLSQSTSAVHLHVLDPAQIQLPRKLSKRRKPFTGLFGGAEDENEAARPQILRRQSALAPSMTSLPSLQGPVQKSKRGSVLGRIVKRFSILRKTDKTPAQNGYGTDWHHANSLEPSPMHSPTSPQPPDTHEHIAAHLPRTPEPVRRVAPPSIETVQRDSPVVGRRRSSESISIHEIRTSGRLTIANPDDPSSGDSTPQEATTPIQMSYVPDAMSSVPSSKEDLPLPIIPRSESPQHMDSVTSPRPRSIRVADPAPTSSAPPPSTSPPLPDLPPPTPGPSVQPLGEPHGSPSRSTVLPPPSPAPSHVRDGASYVASPASTVTPLPPSEDNTLARASMYVNPPTPYATNASLVVPPATTMPDAQGSSSSKRPERSATKSRDGTSRSKSTRQTETYKLVRSPSATVKPSEVIVGMGEQWELVGSAGEPPKKSKSTRDKDRSRSSDQEQVVRREESRRRRESSVHREEHGRFRDRSVQREESGRYHDREESRRRRDRSSSTEEGDSRHKRQPSSGGREKPPSITSVRSTQTPIASRRSVKKVSEAEERRTSKASSANTSASVAMPGQERERHLSVTAATRPNSELHSAAELSVRAKDAWDMDRLWKARSMAIGPDGLPMVSAPATIGSESRPSTFIGTELQRVSSIPSVATVAEMQKASPPQPANQLHGSSHTYVVVQTPSYEDDGESLLPYMSPTPRHSTMSTASQYYRHTGYAYNAYTPPDPRIQNPLPNPPRLSAYQSSPLPMEVVNPLPSPPRLSSYKPAPLPASLASDNSSAAWRSPYGRNAATDES